MLIRYDDPCDKQEGELIHHAVYYLLGSIWNLLSIEYEQKSSDDEVGRERRVVALHQTHTNQNALAK